MAKILIYALIIVFFALISYALRERLGSKALPFLSFCVSQALAQGI